jgi:hypothetical protein
MVSSMATCNDGGKRFSAWAEGRGKSGFVSHGTALHLILGQKIERERDFWRHNMRSFLPKDYGEVCVFCPKGRFSEWAQTVWGCHSDHL